MKHCVLELSCGGTRATEIQSNVRTEEHEYTCTPLQATAKSAEAAASKKNEKKAVRLLLHDALDDTVTALLMASLHHLHDIFRTFHHPPNKAFWRNLFGHLEDLLLDLGYGRAGRTPEGSTAQLHRYVS